MATLPGHGAESQALPFAQCLQSAAAAGGTLPLQGAASQYLPSSKPQAEPTVSVSQMDKSPASPCADREKGATK